MIRVCLFNLIFLTLLSTINTKGCNSFKNTNVSVNTENSFYVVSGCLEPKKFRGKKIEKVTIHNEITRLGKNSIRNLQDLEWIDIRNNSLETLEPQAFRNVPSLKFVTMIRTNVKEIPKDVFNLVPTIKTLILNYNKIDYIASGAFSNMQSLEEIELISNALTYWNREWFQNCPNLAVIYLIGNKISTIPRSAFASLPMLTIIDFGDNKITTIEPDAFRNLNNLIHLGLGRNLLTSLDQRAFSNRIYIGSLYANQNRLNYLPDKLLSKLSVGEIYMYQNPWKCPCMQRIHDWLFFTNGSVRVMEDECRTPYDPVCVVAQVNTCQETVDEEMTRSFIGHMKKLTETVGEACTVFTGGS